MVSSPFSSYWNASYLHMNQFAPCATAPPPSFSSAVQGLQKADAGTNYSNCIKISYHLTPELLYSETGPNHMNKRTNCQVALWTVFIYHGINNSRWVVQQTGCRIFNWMNLSLVKIIKGRYCCISFILVRIIIHFRYNSLYGYTALICRTLL